VTWEVNPYHTDDAFVIATRFERRIAPGLLLTAGLLTHIGGLWAFLSTEMHFEFVAPVYIGDTITAEAEVADRERGLSLRTAGSLPRWELKARRVANRRRG